jgi:hypothetical protein
MSTTERPPALLDAAPRCSEWARTQDLSPAGTIGTYPGYLLVEVPLPWPRDVGSTPAGEAVAPLLRPHGIRLQAVLPAEPSEDPSWRRVVLHAPQPATEGFAGFAGYRRLETVAGASLADTVAALLAAAADPAPSAYDVPGRDLLVCTHGSRDGCCGRHGANLAVRLRQAGIDQRPGVHLWRTSHTGGHRFAPTFLVLPEGTAWGYGDPGVVDRVLGRHGRFVDFADHYRGCTGLGGTSEQLLEAEVLRRVGWSLLDRPRTGHTDGTAVSLSYPDGDRTVTWTGELTPGREVPVPGCRMPVSEAASETEWTVRGVGRS